MSFDYDVTIIGAGPIGSTLAYELAKEDINVCLIDKKKVIGLPLQCAGIINKRVLDVNQFPDELILNKAKGAVLHSKNHSLTVSKEEDQAIIIDRVALDQFIYNRAIENGVDSYFSSKVLAIDDLEGKVSFKNESAEKSIKSKIIVGADGPLSIVSSAFGNDFDYYCASQYLVKIEEDNNQMSFVDLYAYGDLFPGFIWQIPVSKNIFSAASQVKPTTGGGLLIGFEAVGMAKKAIVNALNSEDFNSLNLEKETHDDKEILENCLKSYQDDFEERFIKEFSYQFKVQKTLCTLSDDDLDYFFEKLKEKEADKLISEYGDMDNQSILVKEFLKRGLVLSLLPAIHKKELAKIWLL